MTETGQTIDRLQVEITANLSEFMAEMESITPAIDSAKTKLETLEDTTGGTADNLEALAGSTSKSKTAFTQYTATATTTESVVSKLTRGTGSLISETEDLTDAMTKTGKSARDAVSGTESLKDGIESAIEPIDEMKNGTQKLIGVLKFTGVATAAGIAFNAIKSYIEDVKSAADQTYQTISNMETGLSKMSGKLTATDQAVIDATAPYTTDTQTSVEIQTKIKQTQAGTTATEQTQLIDAFTTAGKTMGISPTELYSSVYNAMVKAGEDPTPSNILTLLDGTISPVWQTTGADVKQILTLIGSNAADLKNTDLSLSELIQAGGQSYQKTQDYTQFEEIIKGTGDAYTAAYDAYLKQAGAGDEDTTTWLKKQSQADQIRLTEGATQAGTAAAKTIGDSIREGIKDLDLSGALTLTQSKFFGMTDQEIQDYTNIKKAQYSEDGKYNIFELGNQIDQPYYNQLRYTNIAEESGQITKDQYVADIGTAELIRNSAVTKTWADLPKILTGQNVNNAGEQKTGEMYYTNAQDFYTNKFKGTGTTLTGTTATLSNIELPEGMEALEIPVTFTPDLSAIHSGTEDALKDASTSGMEGIDTKDIGKTAGTLEELGGATKEAADNVEDLQDAVDKVPGAINEFGKSSENSTEQVKTFNDEGAAPLAGSLTESATALESINDSNETYLEALPGLQESMTNEKTTVDNLTASYLALAAAKREAAEA